MSSRDVMVVYLKGLTCRIISGVTSRKLLPGYGMVMSRILDQDCACMSPATTNIQRLTIKQSGWVGEMLWENPAFEESEKIECLPNLVGRNYSTFVKAYGTFLSIEFDENIPKGHL
jgi:hypothetical protein